MSYWELVAEATSPKGTSRSVDEACLAVSAFSDVRAVIFVRSLVWSIFFRKWQTLSLACVRYFFGIATSLCSC